MNIGEEIELYISTPMPYLWYIGIYKYHHVHISRTRVRYFKWNSENDKIVTATFMLNAASQRDVPGIQIF